MGLTVHTKTYILTYFYSQHLVLFTMVLRDRNAGSRIICKNCRQLVCVRACGGVFFGRFAPKLEKRVPFLNRLRHFDVIKIRNSHWFGTTRHHIVQRGFSKRKPYRTVSYCTASHRTVPYRTVQCRTTLYRTVSYHTIQYRTV